MKKNIILLIGPPGSGKGTQAKILKKELGIPHISTGDLLRQEIHNTSVIGKEAKKYIDQGQYVPNSIVIQMLFNRIALPDCSKGYILDGFPRTMEQVIALDEHIKDSFIVISLVLSQEVIIQRLSGRLTCVSCGAMFNKYFSPPEKNNLCDLCGDTLSQRSDDKEEVVQERLSVFKIQTAPLLNFYKSKKVLKEVDASKSTHEIFTEIFNLIS